MTRRAHHQFLKILFLKIHLVLGPVRCLDGRLGFRTLRLTTTLVGGVLSTILLPGKELTLVLQKYLKVLKRVL